MPVRVRAACVLVFADPKKILGTGGAPSKFEDHHPGGRARGPAGSSAVLAKTWLPELDVAPVEELSGCDFVLEVESAGGTLKDAGAAALNDFVLATSVDL